MRYECHGKPITYYIIIGHIISSEHDLKQLEIRWILYCLRILSMPISLNKYIILSVFMIIITHSHTCEQKSIILYVVCTNF